MADETKKDAPKEKAEKAKSGGTKITNNYTSPLEIFGVRIPAGETMEVPEFDPKSSAIVAAWVQAKVITVS